MKVTLPKKEDVLDEQDELPVDDVEKPSREHELELELAEKRGELKALKANAGAASNQNLSVEQTKQLVFGDINNLSDEDFQKKYKTSKHSASMTVMDADNRQTKAEAKQLHAEAKAAVVLSSKYPDFGKYDNEIREGMEDLSEAARQDPDKLARWMESKYLALQRGEDRPLKKAASDDRRKVVSDFEKPVVVAKSEEGKSENDEIPDEIPAESDISNQKLANFMGLRSEKERKELAGKNLIYVDMNLGDGWHFGDPKRGFERVEKKVA